MTVEELVVDVLFLCRFLFLLTSFQAAVTYTTHSLWLVVFCVHECVGVCIQCAPRTPVMESFRSSVVIMELVFRLCWAVFGFVCVVEGEWEAVDAWILFYSCASLGWVATVLVLASSSTTKRLATVSASSRMTE